MKWVCCMFMRSHSVLNLFKSTILIPSLFSATLNSLTRIVNASSLMSSASVNYFLNLKFMLRDTDPF